MQMNIGFKSFLPVLLTATFLFAACGDSPQEGAPADTGAAVDTGAPVEDTGSNEKDADVADDMGTHDASLPDASVKDAGADGGEVDAAAVDAGADAGADAGPDDAGFADAGKPDGGQPPDAGLDAGSPDAGQGSKAPVWILHISDTHIGENTVAAPNDLDAFLTRVLPVVQPSVTLNTGDLTDSGTVAEFDDYWGHISGRTAAFPGYIEIIGNHDVKTDGVADFLSTSLTGRAGAGAYGVTYVDGAWGRIGVVRTNTSDSTSNLTNISGYFGATQKDELLALPASPVPVTHPVLMAHHPYAALATLKTDANMDAVIARYQPQIYFCGHVHTSFISWHGSTLLLQAATLGKVTGTESHFMLAALDDDGPAALEITIDYTRTPVVTWPIVLITAPGDTSLGTANPVPKKLGPGQAAVPLRAAAFSPTGVTAVDWRIDSGAWKSMTGPGPVWETTFTTPSVANSHTIEVRATSAEGTASHTVKVVVQ